MKWLQVLLFDINYSSEHNSFICTHSNGSKYCYVIPIVQLRHTIKVFKVLLCITNNPIKHQSFVYIQFQGIHPPSGAPDHIVRDILPKIFIIKGFRTLVFILISTTYYVLWPSSGVCRTRKPSRNFELRPLLNPRGSPVLILITGYKC